jgi:hypothetical protein
VRIVRHGNPGTGTQGHARRSFVVVSVAAGEKAEALYREASRR